MNFKNGLNFKKNLLHWNDISLQEVASQYETPFYLYSLKTIEDNFLNFRDEAIAAGILRPLVCFALKSNSNPILLRHLSSLGAGADIVSQGELKRATDCGVSPQRIVFSGVGKTDEEIHKALTCHQDGIYSFNVESIEELKAIDEIAGNLGKIARVAFRLNPKVSPKTHKYISTGNKSHKFGILEKDILDNKNKFQKLKNIKVVGLSVHIGSQLTQFDATESAIISAAKLAKKLDLKLEFLDVGGGLGVNYKRVKKLDNSLKLYMKKVASCLKNNLGKETLDKTQIVFEPGRCISATAGILVTQVVRTKNSGKSHFVIVDGGMNDFVRTSLYEAYHEVLPLKNKTGIKSKTNVVGPICETADYFAINRNLPRLVPKDYIAVLDTGAYGHVMSSYYNLRERPQELVLTNSGEVTLE